MPQEWSGLVTANSLPVETRRKQAGMAQLIESSLRMSNIREGGRHHATPSGFPATVTLQAGGVYKVEVSSLAVKSADMSLGNDSEVGYDDVPTDAFGRAAALNNSFREFAYNTIGRVRIEESYGPKAGFTGRAGSQAGQGAIGIDDDFPHRPGYGPRMVPSYSRDRVGQPRPSYSRSRDAERSEHLGKDCALVHPTMSHLDWQDSEEEELRESNRHRTSMLRIQERITRRHYGIPSSCLFTHGGRSHESWLRNP